MTRLAGIILLLFWLPTAWGKTPVFEVEIRDHLFHPEDIHIPANTKVKLVLYNRDATPEEFESYELNREKVIMGGRKANIFIGPLEPGTYPFFGEFNPKTAQGRVVVE
jgi:heme/copper-type cytochrome/quinol oxidase subunit 2